MKKLLSLLMLMLPCATLASAQDDYHRVEVYGGYSYLSGDVEEGDRQSFNGFNASITVNVSRYVGLKFDYAYHRDSFACTETNVPGIALFDVRGRDTLNSFLGGVQFKDNSSETRVKPFAHVLIGASRFSNVTDITGGPFGDTSNSFSNTGFSAAIGGGLDIRAGRRVDIRVIQFDYNPTRRNAFDDSLTLHNFRIGAGIVFH